MTFSLIRQISRFYDSAYGWGIFPYGSAAAPVDTPMGIIGCFIALAVSWTVCRQQSLWPAAAAVLLPICACLVVTDTVPDARYLYLVLLGFLILVMTNTVRRKNVAQGVTLTGIVSVPLALALGRRLLEGAGAIRVHGGGFAGTIQAFVPVAASADYARAMDAIFGEGACHILSIRPQGGVEAFAE